MSEENVRTNKEDIKAKIRKRYAGIDPDLLEVIPAKEKPNIKDTTTMKRVAIYVRVSTDDPNQTTSFELQKNYYDDIISKNPSYNLVGMYADATDIIGLKQNPTNGRRFSPIFSFIGHFSIQNEKMLLLKQRRKTEYGKDKAFVDLSKSMNAFRHFREQEALWQTQSKKYHWRNFTLFRITHSV
ncbi:MAG: hypothetical protein J6A69_07915 [Clostridia bacterium]|nr:hypothetical protein [Clostridia bacterium]